MSNKTTTSWVLNLVDNVTKPLKSMSQATGNLRGTIDKLSQGYNFNKSEINEALIKAKQYYNESKSKVTELEAELKSLNKAYENALPGSMKAKAKDAFESASIQLQEYKKRLNEAEQDVKDLGKEVDNFKNLNKNWASVFTGVNQGVELVQRTIDSLNFTTAIMNLQNDAQRLTDLTGDRLSELVKNSQRIADVFGADALEVVKSANALTKQVGGTYEENLKFIEAGFKRGANINGDFLDQLHEYAPKIKDSGITISEAIGLISTAGKEGVWSDKALDAIKEADQSLKEMGQTQRDALSGIGIDYKSLEGLTSKEAIQVIAKQMKTASTSARQLVLADIFKGAGEDAGLQIIEGFSEGFSNIYDLPEVEQSGEYLKGKFSEIKTWFAQSIGSIGTYSQILAPVLLSISSAIPILQMLSKATIFQTIVTKGLSVAQWLLNVAMSANPIAKVVLGISALIAGITWAWNKFEGFRLVIFKGWEALKLFGSVIKEFVLDRIKGVLSGISGLAKAIGHLFNREWSKAADSGKQALNDLLGIDASKKALENFKGGLSDAMTVAENNSNAYTKSLGQEEKSTEENSINDYVKGNVNKLGGFNEEKTKSGGNGSKKDNSLNVGGGNNGIKSITQTLTVNNSFYVDKNTNVRDLAEKVVGYMNDSLRDSIVNIG